MKEFKPNLRVKISYTKSLHYILHFITFMGSDGTLACQVGGLMTLSGVSTYEQGGEVELKSNNGEFVFQIVYTTFILENDKQVSQNSPVSQYWTEAIVDN